MSTPGQTLGTNVRRLRLARGLSLVELGRVSGLAKGTLTQLEAGRGNPTVETLHALALALGTELADLVAEHRRPVLGVVRANEGYVTTGKGSRGRLVERSRIGSTIVELFSVHFEQGPPQHSQAHGPGVIEQVYVLAGRLEVGCGDLRTRLEPHDFARFQGDRPHVYEPLDGDVHALMWQFLPVLPSPPSPVATSEGAAGVVEALVPQGPRPDLPGRGLPQPPVRGRRPPTRTPPAPGADRPGGPAAAR